MDPVDGVDAHARRDPAGRRRGLPGDVGGDDGRDDDPLARVGTSEGIIIAPIIAAAGFLAMWVAMMGAMMIPSLVPTLARDRLALESPLSGLAPDGLAALGGAGTAYFAVWAVMGAGVYVVGTALVAAELRWPALAPAPPIARGVVLVAAGWVQLTPWKARHLACCRDGRPGAARSGAGAGAGLRRGGSPGGGCVLCRVPVLAPPVG